MLFTEQHNDNMKRKIPSDSGKEFVEWNAHVKCPNPDLNKKDTHLQHLKGRNTSMNITRPMAKEELSRAPSFASRKSTGSNHTSTFRNKNELIPQSLKLFSSDSDRKNVIYQSRTKLIKDEDLNVYIDPYAKLKSYTLRQFEMKRNGDDQKNGMRKMRKRKQVQEHETETRIAHEIEPMNLHEIRTKNTHEIGTNHGELHPSKIQLYPFRIHPTSKYNKNNYNNEAQKIMEKRSSQGETPFISERRGSPMEKSTVTAKSLESIIPSPSNALTHSPESITSTLSTPSYNPTIQSTNEVLSTNTDYVSDLSKRNGKNGVRELDSITDSGVSISNSSTKAEYLDITSILNENNPEKLKRKLIQLSELCKKFENLAKESIDALYSLQYNDVKYSNSSEWQESVKQDSNAFSTTSDRTDTWKHEYEEIIEKLNKSIAEKDAIINLLQKQVKLFESVSVVNINQSNIALQKAIGVQSSPSLHDNSNQTFPDIMFHLQRCSWQLNQEIQADEIPIDDKHDIGIQVEGYDFDEIRKQELPTEIISKEFIHFGVQVSLEEFETSFDLPSDPIRFESDTRHPGSTKQILHDECNVCTITTQTNVCITSNFETQVDLQFEDSKNNLLKYEVEELEKNLRDCTNELETMKEREKQSKMEIHKLNFELSNVTNQNGVLKEQISNLSKDLEEKDLQLQDALQSDIMKMLEADKPLSTAEDVQYAILDCLAEVEKMVSMIKPCAELIPKQIPASSGATNSVAFLYEILNVTPAISHSSTPTNPYKLKNILPSIIPKKPCNRTFSILWNKVEGSALMQSVWIQRGLAMDSNAIGFDFHEIETIFSCDEPIRILDDRTYQNISHLLKSLNRDYKDICNAVTSMDESIITEGIIFKLLAFLPPESEEIIYQSFHDKLQLLTEADQFLYLLFTIPRIRSRLRLWRFKMQFTELFESITEDLNLFHEASNQLISSHRFQGALRILLAIGNFLNGNHSDLVAYGFSLRSLPKFLNIHCKGDHFSLLHYIAKFIKRKYTSLVDFDKEMKSIHNIVNLSFSSITEDYEEFNDQMKALSEEVEILKQETNYDTYTINLLGFYEDASEKMESLKNEYEAVVSTLRNVAVMYGEKEESLASWVDSFFLSISIFLEKYKIERLR